MGAHAGISQKKEKETKNTKIKTTGEFLYLSKLPPLQMGSTVTEIRWTIKQFATSHTHTLYQRSFILPQQTLGYETLAEPLPVVFFVGGGPGFYALLPVCVCAGVLELAMVSSLLQKWVGGWVGDIPNSKWYKSRVGLDWCLDWLVLQHVWSSGSRGWTLYTAVARC